MRCCRYSKLSCLASDASVGGADPHELQSSLGSPPPTQLYIIHCMEKITAIEQET